MNVGYPKDCIFIFDNFLTDEECLYFIEMIDKYAVKGREKYGHRSNVTADSVNVAEISDTKVQDLTFEKVLKYSKKSMILRCVDFRHPPCVKLKVRRDGTKMGPLCRNGYTMG
jgi:hypothetical protein